MQKREDFMNFCLQSPQSDRFCGKIQGIDKKTARRSKNSDISGMGFFYFSRLGGMDGTKHVI